MDRVGIEDEIIEQQEERANREGDARLLRIAFLRRFVEEAERSEGRTNGYFSNTLRGLIKEAEANR